MYESIIEATKRFEKEAKQQHLIISICQYCCEVLREEDADSSEPGVSHGICDKCLEEQYPACDEGWDETW